MKKYKVHTKIAFRRPLTHMQPAKPKVLRKGYTKFPKRDMYAVIKAPMSSESAIKTVEDNNTLVFIVDSRATKKEIKHSCEKLYNFKPIRVNTLIRPDGKKKAYVKVPKDIEALEIANKIGIM